MDKGKGWMHSKKTSNVLLIIIAASLLLVLVFFINVYRQSLSTIVQAQRYVTNTVKPFANYVQEARNSLNTNQNVQQTVSAVANRITNTITDSNLQNQIQSMLRQYLEKVILLKSTKDIIKNKKLEITYKKLDILEDNIHNELNNGNDDESILLKINDEFEEIFKHLMLKSNYNKYLKLFAIKNKLL